MRSLTYLLVTLVVIVGSASADAAPAGTAITYQGRLILSGTPVDGSVDLRFTLHDAESAGAQIGSTVQADAVTVTNGVFTAVVDFGAGAFDGTARWVEIAVRNPHDPGDSGPFVTLSPRQPLTPAPYALFALNGAGGGGGGGYWQLVGSSLTNSSGNFVGVNRSSRVTSSEYFGVQAPVGDGSWGGMYIGTDGEGKPFYGYDTPSKVAWTQLDGQTGIWALYNSGYHLNVTEAGDVGIGVGNPGEKLQVAGTIHSTTGGFRFPDGTIQTTAAGGGGGGGHWSLSGDDLSNTNGGQVLVGTTDASGGAKLKVRDESNVVTYLDVDSDLLSEVRVSGGSTMGTLRAGGNGTQLVSSTDTRLDLIGSNFLFLKSGDETTFHNGGQRWMAMSGNGALTFYRNNTIPTVEIQANNAGTQGGQIKLWNDVQTANATAALDGEYGGGGGGALLLSDAAGNQRVELAADLNPGDRALLKMYQADGDLSFLVDTAEGGSTDQGGTLKLYNDSGVATIELDADHGSTDQGRVITQVLEITGGSDLSENFDIGGAELDPGTVVSIDPASPGDLVVSGRAYDRRVAGIVSGAGGVRPGLLMGQRGSEADGAHPVALTGRVYCKVDASYGAVAPGDLLTTSPTPGHAMVVGDHAQAQGAILGKAMGSLDAGTGMVLVLVSLQ